MTEPRRRLDDYSPGEMALPEWKLIQNVGGEYAKALKAEPGDFFCEVTGETKQNIEIVVVDIQSTRTYWGRDEIEDSPPTCASLDAKSMIAMGGADCSICPNRCDTPWMLKPTERRQMCLLSYNILGIEVESYLPILIRAGGISALPARQLITQLRLNRALRGEYYRALINVSSVKKKTSAGEAYSLNLKIKELIQDKDKVAELKSESNQLLGAPIALPIGRDDEDIGLTKEPVAYTPEGEPIYEEPPVEQEPIAEEEPPVEENPAPIIKKEENVKDTTGKKPLDLDF